MFEKMPRFRVKLSCNGLSDREGTKAPSDILVEFSHRPWHQNVSCDWDGTILWLEAENDYDKTGLALLDEFSDAVFAWISFEGDIRFKVESVVTLPAQPD